MNQSKRRTRQGQKANPSELDKESVYKNRFCNEYSDITDENGGVNVYVHSGLTQGMNDLSLATKEQDLVPIIMEPDIPCFEKSVSIVESCRWGNQPVTNFIKDLDWCYERIVFWQQNCMSFPNGSSLKKFQEMANSVWNNSQKKRILKVLP